MKASSRSVSRSVMSDSLRSRGLISPPGSSVHGILQARILEWSAMPSSRGPSQPRDRTHISYVSLHWQADSLPSELQGGETEKEGNDCIILPTYWNTESLSKLSIKFSSWHPGNQSINGNWMRYTTFVTGRKKSQFIREILEMLFKQWTETYTSSSEGFWMAQQTLISSLFNNKDVWGNVNWYSHYGQRYEDSLKN